MVEGVRCGLRNAAASSWQSNRNVMKPLGVRRQSGEEKCQYWLEGVAKCVQVEYISRTFLVSNKRKHFIFSLLLAVPGVCVCECVRARECGSGRFENVFPCVCVCVAARDMLRDNENNTLRRINSF